MEQALSLPYATLRFAQLGWRVIRLEATPHGDTLPGDPNRYIGAQLLVVDGHRNAALLLFDGRLSVGFVGQKNNSRLSGFLIEELGESVCADIPVQDIDLRLRFALFELDCVLDAFGATET